MKLVKFLILIAFLSLPSLSKGEIALSGYIGPVTKYTFLNSEFGFLLGGRGGLLVNHVFSVGAGGYSLINRVDADHPKGEEMDFMYGGVTLDWMFVPFETVHGGFTCLFGKGYINLNKGDKPTERFFVIEPEWFFQGNVTSFLQIDLGFSYRWAFDVDSYISSWWQTSQAAVNLMVKFGKFKIDY